MDDNIKYCLCTEGCDKTFAYLRVMLMSFLKHNCHWFNQEIVIFTCDLTPLSTSNRKVLNVIYKNIRYVDIDVDKYKQLNIKDKDTLTKISLYRLNIFYLKNLDLVIYINHCTVCLRDIATSIFVGKSDVVVVSNNMIGVSSLRKARGRPNKRRVQNKIFDSNLMLISKDVLDESIGNSIFSELVSDKKIKISSINTAINKSLYKNRVELNVLNNQILINKSSFPDSKKANLASIFSKVCLIHLDIGIGEKIKTSADFRYKKINSIWLSYNDPTVFDYNKVVSDLIPDDSAISVYNKRLKKSNILRSHRPNHYKKLLTFIKNKTVCIVGPSSSLLGKNMGELIDSHDVIVRFNGSLPIPKDLEIDYGSRTDVLYINNFFIKKSGRSIVPYLYKHTKFIVSKVGLGGTIRVSPKSAKGSRLMGNIAIVDLLLYNPSKIYITGIDFYNNTKNFKSDYHRPEHFGQNFNPQPGKTHSIDFNIKDLKMLHADNRHIIEIDEILKNILYGGEKQYS